MVQLSFTLAASDMASKAKIEAYISFSSSGCLVGVGFRRLSESCVLLEVVQCGSGLYLRLFCNVFFILYWLGLSSLHVFLFHIRVKMAYLELPQGNCIAYSLAIAKATSINLMTYLRLTV